MADMRFKKTKMHIVDGENITTKERYVCKSGSFFLFENQSSIKIEGEQTFKGRLMEYFTNCFGKTVFVEI